MKHDGYNLEQNKFLLFHGICLIGDEWINTSLITQLGLPGPASYNISTNVTSDTVRGGRCKV